MFNQVMNSCTENFECLVLDNTSRSNKIEDCVFWYKAKLHDNFRIGSPALWNFHQKNYNPRHDTQPTQRVEQKKRGPPPLVVTKGR